MQNSTSVAPYMSSNLREYNRIYKEVNDIYREIAARFGLSNSAFDILYTICEVGDGACSVMCAMLLLFPNTRYIHPSVN